MTPGHPDEGFTMSNNIPDKEQVDRVIELLELRLDHMQGYHDHKETMAHAALLVALAVAGFVLTSSEWPPKWVPPIYIPAKWVALLGLTVVWLAIHWYLRWQLRNRRFAAQLDACLMNILRKWAVTQPSKDEINPATQGMEPPSGVYLLLDFFYPLEKAAVPGDEGLKGYPMAVVTEFAETPTGAFQAERVVSLANLLLFALVAARTLR